MALIKCTECGAMISDQAKSCPKCGCPVEYDNHVEELSNRPRRNKKWILLAVVAILAIGSGAAYFIMSKDNTIKNVLHKEPIVRLTPEFCKTVRKYSCLCDFEDGFAAVQNGEKWGFINTEGKEVVPCIYDMLSGFKEELAAVCKKDKWGYVNTKGEVVIPCIYERASDFSEGLAAVRKNGKEGFINKKGEVAIPLKFEECGIFSEGLAYAGDENGHYFIDTKGEKAINLPKGFTLVEYSSYRYPVFHNGTCNIAGFIDVDYNDHYYIDTKGEKVAPPQSQDSAPEKDSEYEVYRNDEGLVGVQDAKTKKIVIPAKYSSIGESGRGVDCIELHNGVVVATLQYKKLKTNLDRTEDIEWNTDTECIYGYIDLKGNETFTSEDYKLVKEKNNEFKQEASKYEQAAKRPDWLQGEWFFRSSNGTCYARIEGDNILVAFGQDVSYNGPYTIEDDKVIYDRHDGMYCYFPFDRNREVLMMDENNQMYRSADEANNACRTYDSRSSSSGIYSGQNTHPFENDGDVLDFTSGTFYNSEGTRLSLKYNGMYVNGVNTQTTSTVVTSFSGMYARVKVYVIPNGVWTFTVDKANGTLIDMEGGVWRKK